METKKRWGKRIFIASLVLLMGVVFGISAFAAGNGGVRPFSANTGGIVLYADLNTGTSNIALDTAGHKVNANTATVATLAISAQFRTHTDASGHDSDPAAGSTGTVQDSITSRTLTITVPTKSGFGFDTNPVTGIGMTLPATGGSSYSATAAETTATGITRIEYTSTGTDNSNAQNNTPLGKSNVQYRVGTLKITYDNTNTASAYTPKVNLQVNSLYFGAGNTIVPVGKISVKADDSMKTYQLEKGYTADPTDPPGTKNTGVVEEPGDWYVLENATGVSNGISTGNAVINSQDVTFENCAAPKVVLDQYSATAHNLLPGDSKFYSVQVVPDKMVAGGALYITQLEFTISLPTGIKATDVKLVSASTSRLVLNSSVPGQIKVTMKTGFAWMDATGDTFKFTFRLDAPVDYTETGTESITTSNIIFKNYTNVQITTSAATNGFTQGLGFSPMASDFFVTDAHAPLTDSVAIIDYRTSLQHPEDSAFLGAFSVINKSSTEKRGVMLIDFPVASDLRMAVRKVQMPGYTGGLKVTYGKMLVYRPSAGGNIAQGEITALAAGETQPSASPTINDSILDITTEAGFTIGANKYEHVILSVEYEYKIANGFGDTSSVSDFKKLDTLTGGYYGYFFGTANNTDYQLKISRKNAASDVNWDIIHTNNKINLRTNSVFTFKTEIVLVGSGSSSPNTTIDLQGGTSYKFTVRFYVVGSAPDMSSATGSAPSYYVPRFNIAIKSNDYMHIDPRSGNSVNVKYNAGSNVNGESGASYAGTGAQNMIVTTSTSGRGLGFRNNKTTSMTSTDLSDAYFDVSFLAVIDTNVNNTPIDLRNFITITSGQSNIRVGAPQSTYKNFNSGNSGVLPPREESPGIDGGGVLLRTTQDTQGLLVSSMVGYRQQSERISGWHNTSTAGGSEVSSTPLGGSYTEQEKSKIQPFTANGLAYGQYDYRVTMLNNTGAALTNASSIVPIPKRGESWNGTTFGWSAALYGAVSVQKGNAQVKYSTAYETDPNALSFQSWNAGNAHLYRTVCITKTSLASQEEVRVYFPMKIAEAAPEDYYAKENLVAPLAKSDAGSAAKAEGTNIYLKTATIRGLTYIDGDYDQQYYPQENSDSKDRLLSGVTINGFRNSATTDPTTGKAYSGDALYGKNTTGADGYFNLCMYDSTEVGRVNVNNPKVANDMLRFSEFVHQDSPLVPNKNITMQENANTALNGAGYVHNGNDARQAAEGNDSTTYVAILSRNLFIPYEEPCFVAFNANGGLMADNMDGWHLYRYRNHVITQAEIDAHMPEWPGHEFLGWYYGSLAGVEEYPYMPFETPFMIRHDVYVYARWRAIQYTLTYRIEDNDFVHRAWCGEIIDREESPAPDTKLAGRRFVGWADESGRIVDVKKERLPARDLTLTAQYTRYGTSGGSGAGSSSSDSSSEVPKSQPKTNAPSSTIPEEPITTKPAESTWSLLSAILTGLGVVEALVLMFLVLLKKGKSTAAKLLGMLLGILTLPIFFLMNDISGTMTVVNISTLILLVVVVVETILFIVGAKKKKDDEDEADERAEYGYR